MKKTKIQIFVIILLAILVFVGNKTLAQTSPEIMLTWEAKNYSPAIYKGKVIPTRNSFVSAAVTLIDKGKIVNLSRNEIRWFLDRDLFKSGNGITETDFQIPNISSVEASLRIEIRDYKGQNLNKSIPLPLSDPEIIINAPFSDGLIEPNLNIIEALAYFFNISNVNELSFIWSLNDKKTEGETINPNILELNATNASGASLNLTVNASKNNSLELANDSIDLIVK